MPFWSAFLKWQWFTCHLRSMARHNIRFTIKLSAGWIGASFSVNTTLLLNTKRPLNVVKAFLAPPFRLSGYILQNILWSYGVLTYSQDFMYSRVFTYSLMAISRWLATGTLRRSCARTLSSRRMLCNTLFFIRTGSTISLQDYLSLFDALVTPFMQIFCSNLLYCHFCFFTSFFM